MNNRAAILSALQWYVDAGVTIPVDIEPNNRFSRDIEIPQFTQEVKPAPKPAPQTQSTPSADIINQAQTTAKACKNLDELRDAIANFDAHPLKKLATNMVFADGNPKASVMVIGDPPSTDEDRNGQVYCGVDGQLLDKIFDCIGLSRTGADSDNSIYLTHILNWRPPGNRTPTNEEIDISLPFVHRHIELVQPRYIVLMGGAASKAILDSNATLSRLRGQFYTFADTEIPVMATYAPAFLMANPLQKRKVWNDMLMLKDKMNETS